METLRIGIVGVGGMGSFHAATLSALAGVAVTAISDPHGPNADAVHAATGAEIVDDPSELIATADVDGVVIASPDDTHAELALAALARGLPTLCEKPLATDRDSARGVVQAEVDAGQRMIQLGFMREYDQAHRQVEQALASMGTIDHVRAVHRNAGVVRRSLAQIVGQSMVHDIHSVRYLTGSEIVSVHASGAGTAAGRFRHIVAVCRLACGAHAVLEFDDDGFAYEVAVEVLTSDGDVLTGPPTRPVRRHGGSIDVHLGTDWFSRFADAYREQDQAWVSSIRSGAAIGPSTWDGYRAQVVVDAILESLETGATVEPESEDRPALYG